MTDNHLGHLGINIKQAVNVLPHKAGKVVRREG